MTPARAERLREPVAFLPFDITFWHAVGTRFLGRRNDNVEPSRWFRRLESLLPLFMLLVAVAFNLYHLYPEVAVRVPDLNDSVLALLATELAVQAITGEQNLTDPWLATVGMGFPLFHHYQH